MSEPESKKLEERIRAYLDFVVWEPRGLEKKDAPPESATQIISDTLTTLREKDEEIARLILNSTATRTGIHSEIDVVACRCGDAEWHKSHDYCRGSSRTGVKQEGVVGRTVVTEQDDGLVYLSVLVGAPTSDGYLRGDRLCEVMGEPGVQLFVRGIHLAECIRRYDWMQGRPEFRVPMELINDMRITVAAGCGHLGEIIEQWADKLTWSGTKIDADRLDAFREAYDMLSEIDAHGEATASQMKALRILGEIVGAR